MPDIPALLDRTTPTDLAPLDVAALARRSRRRRARRVAVVAAPVLVAVALALGAATRRDDPGVVTGDRTALPGTQVLDVHVFLAPDTTWTEFGAVDERLSDDPLVTDVTYVDRATALAEAQRILADEAERATELEENPDLVLTYFQVRLLGQAEEALAAFTAELAAMEGVVRVTSTPVADG